MIMFDEYNDLGGDELIGDWLMYENWCEKLWFRL